MLWLLVGIRFQVLFHSAPAVLFTFPSRYWFTIGHIGVFSLAGWSRLLPSGFHVPRRTQDPACSIENFDYGACTLFGRPFNAVPLFSQVTYCGPTTPTLGRFGLLRFRSPLLTESLVCFLLLQVLRCFNSLGSTLPRYRFTRG